jgi:Tfp pilus assembly protein PilF
VGEFRVGYAQEAGMKYLMLVIALGLLISGCSSSGRPPGQAVASENNFENGVKQYERDHIKQAIHQFEKAIDKDPTNYKAYFYLGLCYKRRHSQNAALQNFQKAIELNSKDESWVAKVKAEMEAVAPRKPKKK